MPLNSVLANFTKTYKPETGKTYRHTATVRHKGTLIAFAMDSERRIRYTVLNLSDNTTDAVNTAPPSPFDRDAWTASPEELLFPGEIAQVGFGVAGNALLPVFKKEKPDTAEAPGTVLPAPDEANRNKFNYFRSTTARLSADAPFQVLSDGQYIYLFRQAVNGSDTSNVLKTNADGTKVLDQNKQPVPLVNATLLVDRFMLVDSKLMPKLEVRFQRSRSKTRPANRKDSLGAKDLDGNPFFEPTLELQFVGNLTGGRFSVMLLPTAVAGLQRWQIFAENSRTGRMDSFNMERSAEGLFNTRGTPDAAAGKKGYAESALQFTAGDAHVALENGPLLGAQFTIEAWIKPQLRENDTEPLALLSSHQFAEGAKSDPPVSRLAAEFRKQPSAGPSIWVEAGGKLRVGFGDGTDTWLEHTSKPLLTTDAWNHVAVSFDGTSLRFYSNGKLREKTETATAYLNGILQEEAPDPNSKKKPVPTAFKNKPLKIKADGTPDRQLLQSIGNTQHSFCGTLDEIRVWQRARSQRELSDDMNYRLTGLEPALAAYWHFDERAGDEVFDDTLHNCTGALHNCARLAPSDPAANAPVGEHPGLQRNSFRVADRTFASGPATLLYYQQTEAKSGYAGKEKPLKQSGRVMFAAATLEIPTATPALPESATPVVPPPPRPLIAALDFGVSATGRLAQIPDAITLSPLDVASASKASLNDNLELAVKLEAEYTRLDEDLNRLDPVLTKLKVALLIEPSLAPDIVADIAHPEHSGLNEQLAALKKALIEVQKARDAAPGLDKELHDAEVVAHEHANFGGGLISASGFTALPLPRVLDLVTDFVGFSKLISSLTISGPVQVVLVDEAGVRSEPFTATTEFVGDAWNDRAVKVEISETPAHASLRNALVVHEAALLKIQDRLTVARDAIQAERDTKKTRRDGTLKADLAAAKLLVTTGASALMPSIAIDQFGLGISGGLLGFAYTDSAPLLFDSATGSLAMYFQGIDNQFFVAYYDTRTQRARYELDYATEPTAGAKTLTCVARSTEAEMDKIGLTVNPGEDATTCEVVITGPGGVTETWSKVPRSAAQFAKVLNGLADERSFIGAGSLNADGSLLNFDNESGGTKRPIPKGAAIAVGDVRFVVQEAVMSGTQQLQVKKTDDTKRTPTEPLPIFFIGYDYQTNAKTTSLTADLYNGSLFLAAIADPKSGDQTVKDQTVTAGSTLSCQWTADAPGTTLHFDGLAQRAQAAAAKISAFSPAGDLSLETWARPSRVTANARLLHHRTDTAAYTLGLERQDLKSALTFNGSTDFIDLGIKPTLVLGNQFTQEAWIFPEAADNDFHGFLGGGNPGIPPNRAPSLYISEKTKIHAGFGDGTNFHAFLTGAVLKPGDWNHVAATFDGTSYKVYVNGVQRFTTDELKGKTPIAKSIQFIGKLDNFFPGRIDDVRIWSKARTADEIQVDMNRRLGGLETGLIGYWHFEGGKATDFSRNKNDGTLTGSPALAVSPLSAYKVFGGVNGQVLRSRQVLTAGTWNHLTLAFDQAYGVALNGSDSSLDCGNDATLELTQDLTIVVFCDIKALGRDQSILKKGDVANADATQRVSYSLALTAANKLSFTFENVDGEIISCISNTALTAGFHKIAITRYLQKEEVKTQDKAGAEGKVTDVKTNSWFETTLYVDGTIVGEHKYESKESGTSPVEIGSSKEKMTVGKAFLGTICEIRLWNTARDRTGKSVKMEGLVTSTLTAVLNKNQEPPLGGALKGDEKGLVSWWRFQEGTGKRAFDSKSQNHAIISGGLWVNSPDPSGSKLSLYVNGEWQFTDRLDGGRWTADGGQPSEATNVQVLSANTVSQFTVGALQKTTGTFGEHFEGELEDLRIWQITRTEEQIQDNLFRSLIERKASGQVLVEEAESLLAYYTFDANSKGLPQLDDLSLLGNHLDLTGSPEYLFSTAPVSGDTPLVRSALAGMKNQFNGLIGSSPAVQEYADMQQDSNGNLIGVLKRCYAFIADGGQWQLVTGYKVGDMATEWIGQVQFAPELIGFIEGAPPVPSENLTTTSVDNIGDQDDYNQASFVELTEAEELAYTYSASRDKGFDMSVDFNLGLILGTEANVGFGLIVKSVDVENIIGLKAKFEYAQGWLEDASTSVGRAKGKSTSVELRGRFASPEETARNSAFGTRFVPDNVGQALVRSETADVFALRLLRNGALISFSMKPNPDIPKDWNIISFPINPQYTKQGSLDGKIGLQPDVDYPNALTYSPDSSYFKPIEAYALKNKINRDETDLETYFDQYAAGEYGRRTNVRHFGPYDLADGRLLGKDKLPRLYKRNLVNTYVWTADGGLFAETLETMDGQSESIGGSYSFKGMAGIYADLTLALFGVGAKFGLEALFGGHLNLTVNKTRESKSTFGLLVNLDKVERDIYERGTNDAGEPVLVLDTTDPLRPKPKKAPGKVDAYRFMSFYLEPQSDHYEQFFSKIVDPIWLAQSDDPAAAALRGAQQPGKKPACWRVMHRVTYVSRVLPPLDLTAPPSLEKTLQTLDINSNYELIKLLEPYVADTLGSPTDFSTAIEDTLKKWMPELLPHKKEVQQYLSSYFSIADTGAEDESFDPNGQPERVPNQPPIVNAGLDQTLGLDGSPVKAELKAVVIDARIERSEDIFVSWEQASGPAGAAVFDKKHATDTVASFSKRGRYELRLTADDLSLKSGDSLTVIVNERPRVATGLVTFVEKTQPGIGTGLAPVVVKERVLSIRPTHDVQALDNIAIGANLLDTGLGDPATGSITVNWSKKSGLGDVTFGDKNRLDTTVTFPRRGHYLLQLTVGNGTFDTTSEILVAVAARATRDLQALYVFDVFKEDANDTVRDVSGTGIALDLQIAATQNIERGAGFLKINSPTSLGTSGPAARLSDALKSANQLSLEVWLTPTAANAPGLNRILTLSGGPTARNFTLGQNGNSFQFHLRTDTTDLNASNKALAAGNTAVAGQLTHLVVTRDTSGLVRMYVNGAEAANRMVAGSFANWANDFKLSLGDEVGNGPGRAWLGELHLAAVYSRALTPEEVQQNFKFGANENLPPVVSVVADPVVNWADFDWSKTGQKKTIALAGRVTHDRVEKTPTPPPSPALAGPTVEWEQVSGPTDGVVILKKDAASTQFEVTGKGRYAFRLTATDGSLTTSTRVETLVNCPPNVEVKPAVLTQRLALVGPSGASVEANLLSMLKDSGLGDGSDTVTYKWTSSSNSVQFTDADKATAKARFTQRGLFKLQLEVSNGPLSTVVPLSVTVNQMPALTVAALPVVTLPVNSLPLMGSVTNGLGNPADALEIKWSLVSGPDGGTVNFANDKEPTTTATFGKGGLYILRLTATNPHNPELTASLDIRAAINSKPVIDLSPVPDPKALVKSTTQPYVASIDLDATVSDDGLPENPGKVTLTWTQLNKGNDPLKQVDFFVDDKKDATMDVVQVRFKKAGVYELQLEAFDGAESTTKKVTVTVP